MHSVINAAEEIGALISQINQRDKVVPEIGLVRQCIDDIMTKRIYDAIWQRWCDLPLETLAALRDEADRVESGKAPKRAPVAQKSQH